MHSLLQNFLEGSSALTQLEQELYTSQECETVQTLFNVE